MIFSRANALLAANSGLCFSSDPGLLLRGATGKVSDLYSLSEGKWPMGARLGPNECHAKLAIFFVTFHNRKYPFAGVELQHGHVAA